MSLIIEQEICWLKSIALPEILRKGRLLDNYNEKLSSTYQVNEIQINLIGLEEAYMLTQCYRATINFEYAGEKLRRNFMVKKTPKVSAHLYKSVQFNRLFHNEINFYTEILPIIQNINTKFIAPKYYHSEIEAYSALIVLSDFAADGWSVTKDRYGLNLAHARLAVKYLGTFHGFGYAMKHNEKERFEQITSSLKEARYSENDVNREWHIKQRATLKRAEIAVTAYQPKVDKEFIRKFQQLVFCYKGFGRQIVAPREPLATLCHGDYLRNNLAYKYDTDNNGNPLDIMMFDFQTMRYSSPMVDLSLFLALSLLTDVRHSNFESLFDDYCNALFDNYTKISKRPLPSFLSRENLLREYIRFLPYSTSITLYFLMCLVESSTESVEEMFNKQQTEEQIKLRAMQQGGEVVDREIAHQIREMFDLSRLHNVQIDEHIDNSDWIKSAYKFFE